jgi:hypothetical protein
LSASTRSNGFSGIALHAGTAVVPMMSPVLVFRHLCVSLPGSVLDTPDPEIGVCEGWNGPGQPFRLPTKLNPADRRILLLGAEQSGPLELSPSRFGSSSVAGSPERESTLLLKASTELRMSTRPLAADAGTKMPPPPVTPCPAVP